MFSSRKHRSRNQSRKDLTAVFLLSLCTLAGCSVYSAPKSPSLQNTTSVEQTERLFWQAAARQDSHTLTPLISAGAVFTERDGTLLTREQFLDRLKTAPPAEYVIGQAVLRPQGEDVVLTYPASVREKTGTTIGITILSVWQRTKAGAWSLIAHTETPASTDIR